MGAEAIRWLLIEREASSRWLDAGFVDIFRHRYPKKVTHTRWTYRLNARARNTGWRIGCFLAAERLLPDVVDARILGTVEGSDRCPVGLEIWE